jgi:hypothetical protein
MPRLGVPSTTDSARVMADVCGEPAPLPRSTNPRHNDRPGGTFPRVVQRLIETSEKGRKEGAWTPPQGRKPPLQAAARWWRFHVPRRYLKSASSPFIAMLTPGPPREAIDFSKLHAENRRPGRSVLRSLSVRPRPCGSTFMGITRTALLVGPDGARSPASGSKSGGHAAQVIP